MKKIRVLIFKSKSELGPYGGPSGYLYNLNMGLNRVGDKNIEIDFLEDAQKNEKEDSRKILLHKLPKPIQGILQLLRAKRYYRKLEKDSYVISADKLKKYDFIHFHSTFDLYQNKKFLENYNGRVILTSHSPKPSFIEYIDNIYELLPLKIIYRILRKFEKIDKFAFERADYVFFPCEEAEEPYLNNWKFFLSFKENNPQKFKYILTGVEPRTVVRNRRDVRVQYGIPEDAFLITYIGRHNEVKGYDRLKEICGPILARHDNVYVLCAGKASPMVGLKHPRWIEAGWVEDSQSIINAGDLFILPNRETYFDIVMLEVLSLGKKVLVSKTGGNKYFEKFKNQDILYFQSIKEGIKAVESSIVQNSAHIGKIEKLQKIYQDNFTIEKFADNYLQLIRNVELKQREKVSVIITTHNREKSLKNAIESVVKQTYRNIEIIVVDDGSTDNTEKICRGYKGLKYIYIPPAEHKNGNYARNLGIKVATGDYVAFLDDDDEWLPEKIIFQVEKMNSDKTYGVSYTDRIIIVNGGRLRMLACGDENFEGDCKKISLCTVGTTTSAIMVRSEVFKTIGIFDEEVNYWQETELMMRICQKYRVAHVKKPLVLYNMDFNDKKKLTNNVNGFLESVDYITTKHSKNIEKLTKKELSIRKSNIFLDASSRCAVVGKNLLARKYLAKAFLAQPTFRNFLRVPFAYTGTRAIKIRLFFRGARRQ